MDTGRNQTIIAAVLSGRTLEDVGREHSVTRERVRQILRKQGLASPRSPLTIPRCAVEGCEQGVAVASRLWCHAHYRRETYRQNRPPLQRDTHGSLQCYRASRCRCALCVAAEAAQAKRWRDTRKPENLPHGTPSGYSNWSCRCDKCKAAFLVYARAARARLTQKGKDHPELIPHGTQSGYKWWGCRCPLCKVRS